MNQLKKHLVDGPKVGGGRTLSRLHRLLVKAVLENTIDQLAIVSGTLQHVLTLPHNQLQGTLLSYEVVHWNKSDQPLEELLLNEHREKQKVVSFYEIHKGRVSFTSNRLAWNCLTNGDHFMLGPKNEYSTEFSTSSFAIKKPVWLCRRIKSRRRQIQTFDLLKNN